MAITSLTITQLGQTDWRLTFASDDASPVFYAYRDGQLIATTTATWLDVQIPADTYPVFDVVDDTDDAPADSYPGWLLLQWATVSGTHHYAVERLISGSWLEQARITHDGRGYYQWRTAWLADITTHTYRIVAVDAAGNEADPLTLAALMVRHPDPPDVDIAANEPALTLTISEA